MEIALYRKIKLNNSSHHDQLNANIKKVDKQINKPATFEIQKVAVN